MTAQVNSTSPREVLDSVNEPMHPFGLPLGSIRGFFSLLICGFFWIFLLWPDEGVMTPLLGHFFLLALVLMAFVSHPHARTEADSSPTLPWILRTLFIGGSIVVLLFVLFQYPERFQSRLTPDPAEFRDWWGPCLATMFLGFASGYFLRFILGRKNPVFMTFRAWLALIGMLLLVIEIALFVLFTTAENKPVGFLRYWQVVELAFISAYFGSRA